MKFLLLLLLPALSFAQIPKGATIIIVKADSSLNVASMLYDSKYSIEREDRANGFILTTEKNLGTVSVKLSIRKKDSTYQVYGTMTLNAEIFGVEKTTAPIQYKGMKGSPMKDAWNEMYAVAQKLGSGLEFKN